MQMILVLGDLVCTSLGKFCLSSSISFMLIREHCTSGISYFVALIPGKTLKQKGSEEMR